MTKIFAFVLITVSSNAFAEHKSWAMDNEECIPFSQDKSFEEIASSMLRDESEEKTGIRLISIEPTENGGRALTAEKKGSDFILILYDNYEACETALKLAQHQIH
jgi:hypothetical protein